MNPLTIMTMAGHADFKTTQRYINLAGVVFGDQVGLLSDWYARPVQRTGTTLQPMRPKSV
jgi:hypothetical protein